MTLTIDEKSKLIPFFSNLNKNVFVLLNMPEILKGALFSRYSRSTKPLRQLFLEEYLKAVDTGVDLNELTKVQKLHSGLQTEKAESFYRRWLAEYGDDSIAELGGVHVGIESVSVLATKSMEDRRVGLSPLEKSTRYVRFDDKVNGKYKYFRDKKIITSKYGKLYVESMDLLFGTYSKLIPLMYTHFIKKFPKPTEASDKAYEMSIRAKACDTLRGLLPLATLTNMGIFGNGRAYEYMLTKMFANNLDEVMSLANDIYGELDKVIHNFIERIKTERGQTNVQYFKDFYGDVKKVSKRFIAPNANEEKVSIKLLDYDKDAEYKIIAAILFSDTNIALDKLLKLAKRMGKKQKLEILNAFCNRRQGRWNKIGRAFEDSFYHFEIVSDFGSYKDLERHRILTQDKQIFSCDLGFDIPTDVTEAGFKKEYTTAMIFAKRTYDKLKKVLPEQAPYAVTHGYKVRYRMKMNLREAFHLCELRSSPQGHPNYRFIAQEIYKRILEVHPNLAAGMKFVNMSNPGLERLSSEIRREEKLKEKFTTKH